MAATILDVIQHYQRSIERSHDNEERLLHCISKLYKLPVKVEHLQDTGIGKTVNSLRKYNGEIGVAAKALVTKWKTMVAAEEELNATKSTEESETVTPGEEISNKEPIKDQQQLDHPPSIVDDNKNQNSEDGDNQSGESHLTSSKDDKACKTSGKHRTNEGSCTEENADTSHNSRTHHRESDKEHSKLVGEKDYHSKSSHSRHRKRDEMKEKNEAKDNRTSEHKKSSSSHKHKKREKRDNSRDGEKRHKSEKESKHRKQHTHKRHHDEVNEHESREKSSTSSPSKSASTTSKKHDRDRSSKDRKSDSKSHSSHKHAEKRSAEPDEGIDSSMGANFGDVLGMLNVPAKKLKKSNSATSTVSNNKTNSSNRESKDPTMNGVKKPTSASSTNPSSSSDQPPELLSSSAKLAPLDPSIVLELPSISANYKPLPLNPTVMDCVFNTSTSSSSRVPARTLTDAEALSHGISSKTIRTKIYSGIKSGQTFQVPPLFDLCIRFLQKNIDALEYTGGVPFDILRPVLERATPQQLFVFEEYNPYLLEDSDALWKQHVQRNYRSQKRQEMESWREMFLRCQEDQERKLSILAESIKQSQKIIAAPVRKTQLAYVDSLAKPPRNIQRKQEQFGTKSKLIATPAARVAALSSVTPNAAKLGDVRLRVAANTRDTAQVAHVSVKNKKAPLMAKALQVMRGRNKR